MADENTSRLLVNSASFRTENLVRNSCRYTCGKEYNATSPDVLSDGDCRGRDPQAEGGTIGTNLDIQQRGCTTVRNGYTNAKPYGEGNC